MRCKVAILGSGNIGTDLLMKISAGSDLLEVAAMAGIERNSDGMRRAAEQGVTTTADGVEGLANLDCFEDLKVVFDATSAGAHRHNAEFLYHHGKRIVDLTPAALGPYIVPVVNPEAGSDANNVNMVSCGGQATIPIVAAVGRVTPVRYAEIVASISSRSAGPGTRANIDEFTKTTAKGLEVVGGAERGKAIIILNPAEPPLLMRDTIYCLSDDGDEDAIDASVNDMVIAVQSYVPGYRLKQAVQFERIGHNQPVNVPGLGSISGLKTSVFLEVEGAGHYLPKYAGNLDIMTSAAMTTAERLVMEEHQTQVKQ